MKTIRTHTFRGHRWRVSDLRGVVPPHVAECDYSRRCVRIPRAGNTMDELDSIIHESLHACTELDEDAVEETAMDIARLLYRLGWRKP